LSSLLIREEGRLGVVVTFLAVMELLKGSMIEIVQSEPFAPIHVKAKTLSEQPILSSDFDDDQDSDQEAVQ
jgi:segregation and condensation protein A